MDPRVVYCTPFFVAAISIFLVALFIYHRRRANGTWYLIFVCLTASFWATTEGLLYLGLDIKTNMLITKLQYLGIAPLLPLCLLFIITFFGFESWITRMRLVLLSLITTTIIILVWTNSFHNLIFTARYMIDSGPFPMLGLKHGLLWWIIIGYHYFILIMMNIIIVYHMFSSAGIYRSQAGLLLLAILNVWIANAVYISGNSPIPNMDISPIAFTLVAVTMSWGFFRYKLLDILPIAKSVIFKGLGDTILVLDEKDRVIDMNPAAESMFNINIAEIVGQEIRHIFNDYPQLHNLPDESMRTQVCLIIGCHERIYDMIVSTLKSKKGTILGKVVVLRDITEDRMAEMALQDSEEKYRELVEHSPDAIYVHKDGKVIFANEATVRILGYANNEDVIGKEVIDLIHPDYRDTVMKRIKKSLKSGKRAPKIEEKFLKADGSTIDTEVTASPIKFKNKSAMQVIVRDITKHKQARKEKLQAQKTAAEHKKYAIVGQIAGKMAHDFNNILGIIMGNTELALLDCRDEQTKKTLELIFYQTMRGKNLTKNLVAFAKDQEPKQEYFSLNEKIDLVLNLMKKDMQKIEVIKEWSPRLPDLLADPGMVEHAFVNLLQNSIHATGKSDHPVIIIRTYSQEEYICIEIEDNGCGIPKEFISSIFEPAFTLKGRHDATGAYMSRIKGTGYGMANVKKYIEQHKGNILIDSKVGQSTKITISFPVIKKELTQKEVIEIKKKNLSFAKYILLVEDEQAISDVQYRILTNEPCNHKVDIAANGQIAIDLFDRNEYDFASLDYVLQREINGMDVYNHIRKINKTLPILFVSGNLEFLQSIKELKYKDPCVDHVSKPCQNKDYVNAVNELLVKI